MPRPPPPIVAPIGAPDVMPAKQKLALRDGGWIAPPGGSSEERLTNAVGRRRLINDNVTVAESIEARDRRWFRLPLSFSRVSGKELKPSSSSRVRGVSGSISARYCAACRLISAIASAFVVIAKVRFQRGSFHALPNRAHG